MQSIRIITAKENEAFAEEILWALGALSVSTPPNHEDNRFLEVLFNEVPSDLADQLKANGLEATLHNPEEVIQTAWQDSWRENFKPLQIGGFRLVGDWEGEETGPKTILIYPGMAFGTGQHETTQLIIEHLESYDLTGQRVLDAGCGTGILAIAAEKLGAASVYGFDIDPDCKENMERHLSMNKTRNVQLEIGIVEDAPQEQYDLILANITVNVLKEVWPHLKSRLTESGTLISSGILQEQKEEALAALHSLGFKERVIKEQGEWIMIEAVNS